MIVSRVDSDVDAFVEASVCSRRGDVDDMSRLSERIELDVSAVSGLVGEERSGDNVAGMEGIYDEDGVG